jgi:hypothetical protein
MDRKAREMAAKQHAEHAAQEAARLGQQRVTKAESARAREVGGGRGMLGGAPHPSSPSLCQCEPASSPFCATS